MFRLGEDIHPDLSGSALDKLFKKSIYSCMSFLRTSPELLMRITSLSYKQILDIRFSILSKFSSSLRFGHTYYHKLINHCAIIPSDIENFDKLLDYGFMTGNIYELCGFAGCGKTQICKTVTVNICKTSEQQVLYIDTKNSVSARRFLQIAESKKSLNINEILKKIHICQVRTVSDLFHQLYQLESRMRSAEKRYLGFKLIVINSLSSLLQKFHNCDEGLSILNNIASLLKYITHEYQMVILLTNYVKRWTEDMETVEEMVRQEVQQPALGRYWTSVPDVRIMVKKLDSSNECILIVLKSINQPSGKSVKVRIEDDGVK